MNTSPFSIFAIIKKFVSVSKGTLPWKIYSGRQAYIFLPIHLSQATPFDFWRNGDCDGARTSMKSFALDGNYDVIATGSLLGVDNYRKKEKAAHSNRIWGISKNEFSRFWRISLGILDAKSSHRAFKGNSNRRGILATTFANIFLDMMKRYIAIGGMPDIIKSFQQSNTHASARKVQERLLHDFRGDFGRFVYADGAETIDHHFKLS